MKMITSFNLLAAVMMLGAARGIAQTTFTKVTAGPIVNDAGSWAACAWADYDNDGFIDLFVGSTANASEI